MMDCYERLANFLDDLPGGYPRTENGVELRILRRLFTPEEAEVAMCLSLLAEEARVVARRAGLPLEQAQRLLDSLEEKRLIHCFRKPNGTPTYMAEQFVVGFWEGQVDRLNRALVEDFEEYLPTLFPAEAWQKAPQLRTIPVGESITVEHLVLDYERAEAIIGQHARFGVANCICRQEMRLLDHACGKPEETCMAFDGAVDHYVRTGRGREITREAALGLLKQAEQAGLVLQPSNDQNPVFVCMCCGCCCGVLRSIKAQPHPARLVSSAFIARLDADSCAACGVCETRCQMDALTMGDSAVMLDLERCIGCGLCVTSCPTSALTLVRKANPPAVPKNIVWLTVKVARARGKLGAGKAVRMGARSLVDRLLAR